VLFVFDVLIKPTLPEAKTNGKRFLQVSCLRGRLQVIGASVWLGPGSPAYARVARRLLAHLPPRNQRATALDKAFRLAAQRYLTGQLACRTHPPESRSPAHSIPHCTKGSCNSPIHSRSVPRTRARHAAGSA